MKKLMVLVLAAMLFSCSSTKHTTSTTNNATSSANANADGSSYEQAVVIKEKSETSGVSAEYKWLREHYPGYKSQGQSLNNNSGKPYDIITIKTADGTVKKIYFDISNFFGKM